MNFEEGLSKSMEPEAILEIVKDIYHKSGGKVYVSPLTMDDNATSRAYLKHASDDARSKGKLSTTWLKSSMIDSCMPIMFSTQKQP